MDAVAARDVSLVIALTLVILSFAFAGTALATKGGHVGPNPVFGIRTKATQSSNTAWEAAHRAAYPYLLAGAVDCVTSGIVIGVLATLDVLPGLTLLIVANALACGAGSILIASVFIADRQAKSQRAAHT